MGNIPEAVKNSQAPDGLRTAVFETGKILTGDGRRPDGRELDGRPRPRRLDAFARVHLKI